MAKKRTTFYINPRHDDFLKFQAERLGITKNSIVSMLIEAEIKKQKWSEKK